MWAWWFPSENRTYSVKITEITFFLGHYQFSPHETRFIFNRFRLHCCRCCFALWKCLVCGLFVTGDIMESIKVRKHECQERVIIRVSIEKKQRTTVKCRHCILNAAVTCSYFFLTSYSHFSFPMHILCETWIYEVDNRIARVRSTVNFISLALSFQKWTYQWHIRND